MKFKQILLLFFEQIICVHRLNNFFNLKKKIEFLMFQTDQTD